ncbi:MAG: class I SAM-dependent methyltransferase [Parachlamydiaceae bacterium]|nr:class I SAM-dependent methyltransferase [Parachlamydiaceae bacterium]
MPPSKSENNGLVCLTELDLRVYSIGISTGGVAEMRMAELNPSRHIIATTIDSEGAKFAQKYIDDHGFSRQVAVSIEDISKPLNYENEFFDFIYARLVLHYLTKDQLSLALKEIYRILKMNGKLFVVVRSSKCQEAHAKNTIYDPSTGISTYVSSEGITYKRYFHTETSIQDYLTTAGFKIKNTKSFEEQLYIDFQRTRPSSNIDSLIEVLAAK